MISVRYFCIFFLSYLQFSNSYPIQYYDYDECMSNAPISMQHFLDKYNTYWDDMVTWSNTNQPELMTTYSKIYAQLKSADDVADPSSWCQPNTLTIGLYNKCTDDPDHNIVPRMLKYISLMNTNTTTDEDKCRWLSQNGPLFHAAVNRKQVLILSCDFEKAFNQIMDLGYCGLQKNLKE